jgi:hypothetical protein
MKEPFEVAAIQGTWPTPENMKRALDASAELMDPAVRAELWLPEAAARPLKSQGDRILAFRVKFDTSPTKVILLDLCELMQKDIDALVGTARQDLRLSLTPAPWWKSIWWGTRQNPTLHG